MYEITNRTAFPYVSICYVESEWPDGTFTRGSGVVIGVNDVLTAAHVVYNADRGGFATSVTVYPAADTEPYLVEPYGSFDAGLMNVRVADWDTNGDQLVSSSEAQYDMAVLGMRTAIGNTTGWLGTWAYSQDFSGTMVGYPGAGTGMMAESVFADASSFWGIFEIDRALGPGASGGPLLMTSGGSTYVVGVLSSGNGSSSNYAGLFGPGNWEWLQEVMAGNDYLIGGTPAPTPTDDYAATTATTGVVTVGGSATGTINTSTDADWFRITLAAGTYRFDALGDSTGVGTLNDPFLVLYSSSGVALASDDDGGDGLDSLLVYTVTTGGTYYLGVGSADGPFLGTGSYHVSAAAAGYTGTSGADVMVGTAGDDIFRGNGGNDTITGNGGTDTVSYEGYRDEYRVVDNGPGWTVTDRLGLDGTDSLSGVEVLLFADMHVNLPIGANSRTIPAGQLQTLEELYVAFFNRVPDADGLSYWIDQARAGQSLESIADSFYSAALLYPTQTGYSSGMTNASFVNVIYRNVLGREEGADAGGLAYWTDALAHGVSRGELVTTILGSAHSFKGRADYGWVADLLDNKAYVAQRFAVEMGLNYNTAQESIANGMAIADAVTPYSTSAAMALIGVTDGFSTLT
jgi:V8-like Glu-specific endopeptidase